ncbi:MAG: GNAT family N-acetyltransferase [Paracoccaceae bacterium]
MIVVEPSDPRRPQAAELLRRSHALMEKLFPPEDNFFLDIEGLAAPDIRFFAAREGETLVGTAALAIKNGFGEVKSMFVTDEARGKGVGAALMRQIEDQARAEGLSVLKLETGDTLIAAQKLYSRHGFVFCDPFPPYQDAKTSRFMEKTL